MSVGPARVGSPRAARWPHVGLRSVVAHPYAGITGAIEQSGGFVLPATVSVLLVMKVEDSALRPPQFVHGAHATYATIDGACAPFYAQVLLAPLGAYSLLGMPMDELSGQLVDVYEVLGDDGARLGDLVRDAPNFTQPDPTSLHDQPRFPLLGPGLNPAKLAIRRAGGTRVELEGYYQGMES